MTIMNVEVFEERMKLSEKNHFLFTPLSWVKENSICSCGESFYSEAYFKKCPTCETTYSSSQIIDIVNYDKDRRYLMAVWYVLEGVHKEGFRLVRYDLYYTVNCSLGKIEKEVTMRGFIEYEHEGNEIYAYIQTKQGDFKPTKQLKDLTKMQNRKYIKRFIVSVEELQQCSTFYWQTGFAEYVRALRKDPGELNEIDPIEIATYLDYFKNAQNPEIELLLKSGQTNISLQLIEKATNVRDKFRADTRASNIIQLPKRIQRYVMAEEVKLEVVKLLEAIHSEGKQITGEFFEYLIDHHLVVSGRLSLILDLNRYGYSNQEIYDYVNKADLYQAIVPRETLLLWRDYVRMGVEGNLPYERFPNSLKKDHDLMERDYKFAEDSVSTQKYQKIVEKNLHLEESGGIYSIILPKTTAEIVREGKKLRHCVASYIRSMVEGKTIILFVRRTEFLNAPYYTIEVMDGEITQIRGFRNERVKETQLASFLSKWSRKHGIDGLKRAV